MGYIYMIRNKINEKIYIGQTTRSIEKRFEEHQKGKKGCRGIRGAIKKYRWNNFEIDWYECPDEDLNFDEELMVREMGTLSPDGYNLREGGGSHGKMSKESRQKLSEALSGENNPFYGKRHNQETIQKIIEGNTGKIVSKETRQKQSNNNSGKKHPRYGKTHSKETKEKIGKANGGENNSMYGKNGEKHPGSKRVYQYDFDGIFIDSFASCDEAGQYLEKKNGSNISRCACGKYKSAYNFKWSYTFPFM